MSSLFQTKRTKRRSRYSPAVVLLTSIYLVVFTFMSLMSIAAMPRELIDAKQTPDQTAVREPIVHASRGIHLSRPNYSSAGEDRSSHSQGDAPYCSVTLINTDDLTARFSCSVPADDLSDALLFVITIHGVESGNDWTMTTTLDDGLITETSKGVYMGVLVLDSLDGAKFGERYCTGTRPIVAGEDILISLEVSISGSDTALASASAVTNSLFAYDPDADTVLAGENAAWPVAVDEDGRYIARIACARHLQNLDASISGLTQVNLFSSLQAAEIRAIQLEDIDLSATFFTPMANNAIAEYDGQGHTIHGLTVHAEDAAGLFGTLAGSIRSLTISDASVRSDTSAAGILVGKSAGEITISDCAVVDSEVQAKTAAGGFIGSASDPVSLSDVGVYMKARLPLAADETLVSPLFTASEMAGGLVGYADENAPVSIRGSYAATVIGATGKNSYVGGLIGCADAALDVSGSYADCYLRGAVIGGLAGGCGRDSRFDTCYAAGFVLGGNKDTIAAGFVPSSAHVTNSYSVFCFDDPTVPDGSGYTEYEKYAVVKDGSAEAVYYYQDSGADALLGGNENIHALTSRELSSAVSSGLLRDFVTGGKCVPYALTDRTAADARYPYPTLSDRTHYNDWLVVSEAETSPAAPPKVIPRTGSAAKPDVSTSSETVPQPQPPQEPAEPLFARIYETSETNEFGEIVTHRTLVFESGDRTDTYGRLYICNGEACEWDGHDPNGGFLTDAAWADLCWGDVLAGSDIEKVVFASEVLPENTAYWFAGCGKLITIENIDLLNTAAVTSMQGMFSGCRSLTVLDISSLDTAKVTDTSRMFADCSHLITIYADETFAANAADSTNMFSGCESLVGGNGTVYNEALVDLTYACVDQEGAQGYFTSADALESDTPAVEDLSALEFAIDGEEEGDRSQASGEPDAACSDENDPDAAADILPTGNELALLDTDTSIISSTDEEMVESSTSTEISAPDTEETVKKVAEAAEELLPEPSSQQEENDCTPPAEELSTPASEDNCSVTEPSVSSDRSEPVYEAPASVYASPETTAVTTEPAPARCGACEVIELTSADWVLPDL